MICVEVLYVVYAFHRPLATLNLDKGITVLLREFAI